MSEPDPFAPPSAELVSKANQSWNPEPDPMIPRLKAILFLGIGIIFLLFCAWSAFYTREFLKVAEAVPGKVVALNAGGSHPQIEFVTRKGERISYPQGGWIFGMKVGDKVTVLYRPDAPWDAPSIDRFGAVWSLALFTLVLGAGFSLTALGNLWVLNKTKESNKS
jgi:hypothetical protein